MMQPSESAAIEQNRSGIVCVLVDPQVYGAGKLVRAAFGGTGVRYLDTMRRAMPGGWVAMVGRVRRKPARVVACKPGAANIVVDAAFAMARHLAGTSTWLVHLTDEHQGAVLALLAERTETVGSVQ